MADKKTDLVTRKLQEAAMASDDFEEQAENMIWSAVCVTAGLGAVPFGINTWFFVAANTTLIAMLGKHYGQQLSHEGAAKVLRHIVMSVGFTFFATTLGLKFFAEVLKGAGVITMGGATVAGMALDATLGGATTYAIGYTAQSYFRKSPKMKRAEIKRVFAAGFAEGKRRVTSTSVKGKQE
ncbi:MAG: DUF697 domain-containing protein [Planctomycetota bacterium]